MPENGLIPLSQLQSLTPGCDLTPFMSLALESPNPLVPESNDCSATVGKIQADMQRRNSIPFTVGRWFGKLLGTVNTVKDEDDLEPASPAPQADTEGELLEKMKALIITEPAVADKQPDVAPDTNPEEELDELFSKLSITKPCEPLVNHRGPFYGPRRVNLHEPSPDMRPVDQACLLLDAHSNAQVGSPLYIELEQINNRETVQAVIEGLENIHQFANFDYTFLSPQRPCYDFGQITYPTLTFTLFNFAPHILGTAPSPFWTNSHWHVGLNAEHYESAPYGDKIRTIVHELGHLILGEAHPNQLENLTKTYFTEDSVVRTFMKQYDVPNLLSLPDLTVMQHQKNWQTGYFIPSHDTRYDGLKYCEAFNAIRKYGPNLEKAGEPVVHDLATKANSATLTNQGGIGTLDASSLDERAIIYMDAGYCPSQTGGLAFFNAYQSDMTSVRSSLFADSIHLGTQDNIVEITGGEAKLIHVYPEHGSHTMKGYRPGTDKIVFHGCEIPILESGAQASPDTELACGNTMLKLFDVKRSMLQQKDFSRHRMPGPFECFDKQNISQIPYWAMAVGGLIGLGIGSAIDSACQPKNKPS